MFHANFHGDFFNFSKTASRPGLARAGPRVLGGRAGRPGAPDVSISRARDARSFPVLVYYYYFFSPFTAVLGFLSHDGFIGPLF